MGFHADPLQPAPHHLYGWEHRFDDPKQHYRTLYSADNPLTALREVLQDFRPNTKVKADFARVRGPHDRLIVAGELPWRWRQENVLVSARLELAAGALVDLDDPTVRRELEGLHAPLLARHDMDHLDISELRSKDRIVTKTISRTLHDDGASGIRFRSNTDDQVCYVVFEGAARSSLPGTLAP